MKKINFEKLLVATDISRKHFENRDYREGFANILFKKGFGIAAHILSEKIYKSSGETVYSDEEVALMQAVVDHELPPFFIEAFNCVIKNQPEEVTDKQ